MWIKKNFENNTNNYKTITFSYLQPKLLSKIATIYFNALIEHDISRSYIVFRFALNSL